MIPVTKHAHYILLQEENEELKSHVKTLEQTCKDLVDQLQVYHKRKKDLDEKDEQIKTLEAEKQRLTKSLSFLIKICKSPQLTAHGLNQIEIAELLLKNLL